MQVRRIVLVGLLLGIGSSYLVADEILVQPIAGISNDFIRGADISMLAQIEEEGGVYYDLNGEPKDLMVILRENGVNWIRLRLWHNPINAQPVISGDRVVSNKGQPVGGGNNDLERTIGLAKRAKDLGFKFLLDFHYSDFWTDPGKQNKPNAWKDMDINQLSDEIYIYTLDVLAKLQDAGATPDIVQIGNELNNGMLWPEGQIWGDDAGGMGNFIRLLKQASRAIRNSDTQKGTDEEIRIAIHLATGGDNDLYRSIFGPITRARVDFDIIGLSFYPYWHGSLEDLMNNMNDLARRYRKDLVVMETAYAFTEEDGDATGNVFKVYNGENMGYLPTVQGQATVVRDVMNAVANVDKEKGLGVFYWEPGWIPVPGAGWRTGSGNSWDNQAMFDFSGRALPSIRVFDIVSSASNTVIEPKEVVPEQLTVSVGEKVDLPEQVRILYADDSWRIGEVVWDVTEAPVADEAGISRIAGHTLEGNLPAILDITYTLIKNIVPDYSFESGELGAWNLSDPQSATLLENNSVNAHSGDWTYKYWHPQAFKAMATHDFTDIPNGSYTLKCWAMGGGGENAIYLFARDFGNGNTTSITVSNTGWQNWVEYTLPNIEVSNNRCTIGVYIDAVSENWGNFDDFEFYLEVN